MKKSTVSDNLIRGFARRLAISAALIAALLLGGCDGGGGGSDRPTVVPDDVSPIPTVTKEVSATPSPTATPVPLDKVGVAPSFSEERYFCEQAFDLTITAAAPDGVLYYTTDGSEPDPEDSRTLRYEGPIRVFASGGNYPDAFTVKARAYYADGTVSPTAVHTYFVAAGITTRFTNSSEQMLVVSLIGDSADIFDAPNGILYDKNYKKRGDESERPIHAEILDAAGNLMISQYCGVRVYGGVSRNAVVKSLKLFARKSYASGIGRFKSDLFGSTDINGDPIASYDKIVLRNFGNDWQFGFLRDELNHRLLEDAGYPFYEAVRPAVVYLNGEFYTFVWMHESYCDSYLKKKCPDDTKKGEFVVIGGGETEKIPDADKNDTAECREFNLMYASVARKDYTQDENYEKLCQFIDVENYLDYIAYNAYICNFDWPHNNYKAFRYYADEGGEYGEGIYDGRWRFLPHDMDYSTDLYSNNRECSPDTDSIRRLLSYGMRHAPLFSSLMKRTECRDYFIRRILFLMNGALSYEHVCAVVDEMSKEQGVEIPYYIESMAERFNLTGWGTDVIWASPEYTEITRLELRNFFFERKNYMLESLSNNFRLDIDEILAMQP